MASYSVFKIVNWLEMFKLEALIPKQSLTNEQWQCMPFLPIQINLVQELAIPGKIPSAFY